MKKWVYRILLVVCLGVFGYSSYNLWDIYSQKQQVETETKELEEKIVKTKKEDTKTQNVLQPDWKALKEQNANIVMFQIVIYHFLFCRQKIIDII